MTDETKTELLESRQDEWTLVAFDEDV